MFDFLKSKKLPPPPEPQGGVSLAALQARFSDCADLEVRQIDLGETGVTVTALWLDGVVSGTEVSQEVLRPLSRLKGAGDEAQCLRRAELGGVYSCAVKRRQTTAECAGDLCFGRVAIVFAGLGEALTFEVRTKEHRGIDSPSVEKSVLGAKDAFIEVLRVNTSLVRRHLRDPALKLRQLTLGRRAATQVCVLYLEGVAPPEVVEAVTARLRSAEPDGITSLGELEPRLLARPRSVFPQLLHTERPDKFARGLLDGRVGVLADGLPVGLLAPGSLPELMRAQEDASRHAAVASLLLVLRWAALLLSLLLPAIYVAVAMYHQEMIPLQLLLSIIRAKQEVPASTAAEILGMLVAFELVQEAGIRLPSPVGQTVSIIGGLIVGQSAVDARVVSPIAVIVVALAGIAGYTQPDQELGAGIRLWRFLLVLGAALLGMCGVMAGLALLLWLLCDLDAFGQSYLYPLCDGPRGSLPGVFIRPPYRGEKGRKKK